jgi:hypothetical protein
MVDFDEGPDVFQMVSHRSVTISTMLYVLLCMYALIFQLGVIVY